MKQLLLILIFSASIVACTGNEPQQTNVVKGIYAQSDFDSLFKSLAAKANYSLVIANAELLLDSPYVSKTLEVGNDSAVVVNIRQFDCLTLVENVLALSESQGDPQQFVSQIQNMRYRNGEPKGYTSRIHYFSEWVLQNTRDGVVKDVTREIGGEPVQFHISFMSEHPQYYPALKADSTLIPELRTVEQQLSEHTFYMIPKENLAMVQQNIKTGDVLGIVTNIKGLDFAHNGFAIWQGDQLHMLHASSDFKKVMITLEPLVDYLKKMGHMTGIVVLRPIE